MQNKFFNDVELWQMLKKGDHSALEKIYSDFVDKLYNYGLKFTQSSQLIEDAIHDLFVTIWNSRERISTTNSIQNYLFAALRNNLIRNIRADKNLEISDEIEIPFTSEPNTERLMILSEEKTAVILQLQKQLKSLTNRQQEAIYLKYYEERSYEEICMIMDINYQSVRNLISSGLIKMKELVKLDV